MHRFYLPPELCHSPVFELTGAEAHHALHVLRLGPGAGVVVLDGKGGQIECIVEGATKNSMSLAVKNRSLSPVPPCQITLCQAIPKGQLIESIIEKAVELGVSRVVPLITERTVVRLSADSGRAKQAKWQSTAVSAIKQSGSRWLPRIEAPVELTKFLCEASAPELALVGSLRNDAAHPRYWFLEFVERHYRAPASVALWIGPEGDFSPSELDLVQTAGARPMTLGPLVLRSETAATYALSIVNYELSFVPPRAG